MCLIGLTICYKHPNYGSILQSFATIKMLEYKRIQYEIIRYRKRIDAWFVLKSIPRLLNTVLLRDKYEGVQKSINKILHPELSKKTEIRQKAMEGFINKKFVCLSRVYSGYEELKHSSTRYSAIITGSDQLWSPSGLPTNFYNLNFAPNTVVKISYASSFGVSKIPFYQLARTAEYLRKFDYLSMRENTGKEIVVSLLKRDVPVVVDPTLLLTRDQWDAEIPSVRPYQEPYILAYLLGTSPEHRSQVNKLKNETKLKVVVLRHLDRYVASDEHFGDLAPYDVGPEEFVNLVRHAKYVCTDSFHGTIFSILNRKQFIIFNRYSDNAVASKNTRIDSLCSNLGVENRRFRNSIVEEIEAPIDYNDVEERLRRIRALSMVYLDNALSNVVEKNDKSV